ncbi:hypothetical protein PGT21_009778 [Puccinia graminis f. sp. tritici]|uniref:Uncharacterized protein n=1 Tax=Puccinia graminis f. sp. tritici TaxID=56615 RepID=A0A5B0PU43_PUCGR|nr:hypothetical protein PGT21_009778 [Puccinia graminis f. sp. tritici]
MGEQMESFSTGSTWDVTDTGQEPAVIASTGAPSISFSRANVVCRRSLGELREGLRTLTVPGLNTSEFMKLSSHSRVWTTKANATGSLILYSSI